MILGFEAAFICAPLIVAFILPGPAKTAYIEGVSAFGTLAQFSTFAVAGYLFLRLLRRVHGRGFWSLIGPADRAGADLKRTAMAVGLLLLAIELLPPWVVLSDLAEVRGLLRWVALMPLAFAAILLQVGTEELYFRGYLQQQLACLSPSPVVWMGIPSLFFGLSHYFNGIGPADSILYVVWATLLGLACADLTARTGTLGAAIGLHLANNAFALLLVGIQGRPSSGLALFLYPDFDSTEYDYSLQALLAPGGILQLLTSIAMVLVMWLAARIAIRR